MADENSWTYFEGFALQKVEGIGFDHRKFAADFHENFVVPGQDLDLDGLRSLLEAADGSKRPNRALKKITEEEESKILLLSLIHI